MEMKKPRRVKRAAPKALRRTKPRKRERKKSLITKSEARQRAEHHVVNRMFKGAAIRDGAGARLSAYPQGNWTPEDVWVVYKNSEEMAFKSSDVVLVSKRTGRVLYEGSAQDE